MEFIIFLLLVVVTCLSVYLHRIKKKLKEAEITLSGEDFTQKREEMNKKYLQMVDEYTANFERETGKTQEELELLEKQIKEMKQNKEELENEEIIAIANLQEYMSIPSEEIRAKLQNIRDKTEKLIKNKKAVKSENIDNKRDKNNINQLIRSFNTETKLIADNLTVKNLDSSMRKLSQSRKVLNKIFGTDDIYITEDFYKLKQDELVVYFSYMKKLEQEKLDDKARREQLIEEEKVRIELERERTRIEKEEKQFSNEVTKLMKYMSSTKSDIEKQLYVDKIKELEEKISLLRKDKENIRNRQTNTRAGYVYIISNIGSFGENIFKIGVTRRLEPMDRIRELSSASVPFPFDVHAMIFSDDAPSLESILHKTFNTNRLNKINERKEFFKVTLEEIKEVVNKNFNQTVEYIDVAEAYEYTETLKLSSKQ